jgi:hypothetical protein
VTEQNFAGNIIVILANLPDFLRVPVLKKRMMEFFTLSKLEKDELINNALEAGPTIPFPNFSKLFKTWLEIISTLPEEQRTELFSSYIYQICNSPQKLIAFNLDGILEVFLTLDEVKKMAISQSIKKIVDQLDIESKRRLMIIIPDNAKKQLKF